MNLTKVLSPRAMFPRLEAGDKDDAIRRFVRLLAESRGIENLDPLLDAVFLREQKDPTGLEHGIAVPHGKTDAVDDLIAGIATLAEGVDFGARDGVPSRILVMTISPQKRSGPHLQFISEVVRLLRDEALRERLLVASTSEELYGAFIQ
jgi:mannitol/fructose-specific phosphotransferase system IIA component (Ntr-type)